METERTKMLRGELYFSMDPDLFSERQETRKLVKRYNELDGAETPEAQEILTKLLGSKGEECFVEMPFRCDYGSNIKLGDNVYINGVEILSRVLLYLESDTYEIICSIGYL
ncbi:hypothetical protein DVH05_019890 [Phytophthora capsici]|nr:hypothetical protein DVH05_019890 [Phytophthora capsici]